MAQVNIGDIVLIKIIIVLAGQQMENVYHYVGQSDESGADFLDAVDEQLSAAYNQMASHFTNDLDPTSIQGANLTTGLDLGTVPFTWTGGASSDSYLPTGVAALITFPTNTLGRRGRKFLMAMVEGDQVDSLWSSSVLGDMAAYATTLLDMGPWGSADINLLYCIINSDGPPYASTLPTGYLVRDIPAYQRRRKVGVGI